MGNGRSRRRYDYASVCKRIPSNGCVIAAIDLSNRVLLTPEIEHFQDCLPEKNRPCPGSFEIPAPILGPVPFFSLQIFRFRTRFQISTELTNQRKNRLSNRARTLRQSLLSNQPKNPLNSQLNNQANNQLNNQRHIQRKDRQSNRQRNLTVNS
mgnify:CR=1 FL=1